MNNIQSWLSKVGLMIVLVLTPIHSLMIATGVLILIDLLTGLLRARKAGEPITSNGIRRTVIKMLGYQLACISAFVIQTYMLADMPVISIVSGVIALAEGKSILENISVITGVDFIQAFKEKFLGSKEVEK